MKEIITKKGSVEEGKVLVPCEYDDIEPVSIKGKISDVYFKTRRNDVVGIIKFTSEDNYDSCEGFYDITYIGDDCIIASDYDERFGEKFMLMSKDLVELTNYKYDSIEKLNDNVFKVKKDGYYGIINGKGQIVIDCSFKKVEYDNENSSYHIE